MYKKIMALCLISMHMSPILGITQHQADRLLIGSEMSYRLAAYSTTLPGAKNIQRLTGFVKMHPKSSITLGLIATSLIGYLIYKSRNFNDCDGSLGSLLRMEYARIAEENMQKIKNNQPYSLAIDPVFLQQELCKKASINQPDKKNKYTALDYALQFKDKELVKGLLKIEGIEPSSSNFDNIKNLFVLSLIEHEIFAQWLEKSAAKSALKSYKKIYAIVL